MTADCVYLLSTEDGVLADDLALVAAIRAEHARHPAEQEIRRRECHGRPAPRQRSVAYTMRLSRGCPSASKSPSHVISRSTRSSVAP